MVVHRSGYAAGPAPALSTGSARRLARCWGTGTLWPAVRSPVTLRGSRRVARGHAEKDETPDAVGITCLPLRACRRLRRFRARNASGPVTGASIVDLAGPVHRMWTTMWTACAPVRGDLGRGPGHRRFGPRQPCGNLGGRWYQQDFSCSQAVPRAERLTRCHLRRLEQTIRPEQEPRCRRFPRAPQTDRGSRYVAAPVGAGRRRRTGNATRSSS